MAILLWDGQFPCRCASSHVKWALEGQLHVSVVDANKIHLDGGIDSDDRVNGNEVQGKHVVVAQDLEDYANEVSVQGSSDWYAVVLA